MTFADKSESESVPVLVERRDHVLIVTINRPQQRNALSTDVLEGIVRGLDEAEGDIEVRAVVLTGGTKLFASGADIRELRSLTPAAYMSSPRQKAFARISNFPKPLVAAVAGYVLGGGCEIAMSADLIIAADSAVLGQPEINLGILPGAGGTQRWSHVAGRFRAAELVLGASTVDAWTAHRMGMVAEVVPAEHVVTAGIALAERMAVYSPVAQRSAKAALRMSEEVGISAGLDYERAQLGVLLSTKDHFEGIDAFLEKRRAQFTGE
jgi:enoyl-CoA hydratase/carnithine racemase